MPLAEPIGALLTKEWERLKGGVRALDPDLHLADQLTTGRLPADPALPRTVNIPGWDDVVKIVPQYQPTSAERDAYYAARRARVEPNISAEARYALDRRTEQVRRMRQSAQPEYQKAFGAILTALDNVQDLLSTVATAGRLALWAAPRIPGAAPAFALEGRIAALLATEATARGAYYQAVGPTARAAALATLKGVVAERAAVVGFRGAASLVARGALRFVPVVGWVLLASDLLNMLTFMGLVATPLYALACGGPRAAVAAGLPVLTFKRLLCREVWRQQLSNPFGRAASMKRLDKAAGGLPSFGNILEVLQTTESLYGYGLSFGGIIGVVTEAAAAAEMATRGVAIEVTAPQGYKALSDMVTGQTRQMTMAELATMRTSGMILGGAPAVQRTQDVFTTDEHVTLATAYLAALGEVRRIWKGLPWQAEAWKLLDVPLRPPIYLRPPIREALAFEGLDPRDGDRWWLPGNPEWATWREVRDDLAAHAPGALVDFLRPRRNSPDGVFYGALITRTVEGLFLLAEDDNRALTWRTTTDAALFSSLASEGFLIRHNEEPGALWGFWQAARRTLETREATGLDHATWHRLAEEHDILLMPQLSPAAPFPPQWGLDDDELARRLPPR